MPRTPKTKAKQKKIFVLDTSVIIFSHDSILNFAEHDVAIPITVLEELDNFKKGNDTKNFEAREFIRLIDTLSTEEMLHKWIPLNGKTKGKFKVIQGKPTDPERDAERVFAEKKADHKILNAALKLEDDLPDCKVTLVTKDINLRLKAKSLHLNAEDYETGKIKHVSELYTGKAEITRVGSDVVDALYNNSVQGIDYTEVCPEKPIDNQYFILKHGKKSGLAYYHPEEQAIQRVEKRGVYGIHARNAEQTFAIHALLSPHIKLVTIQGVAGTGKTLLALASALELRRNFKQVFLARPIVPLSNKDIGFLPGDIKSKLNPYMEPLWDNLKFIKNQYKETDKEFKQITEMVEKEKLMISPLAYIRGRSLSNIFFIVDEAQNLTPHEVKTIITRAGENTKIVFTGDIYQIDTPYLDSQSNGLSYLIDRVQGNPLYAHITLEKGERSELANLANEML